MNNHFYKIPESVLVVIHSMDLEVLLIERADQAGYWQSVTGSKDSLSEPLCETVVREVFEETGIHIVERAGDCSLPFPDLPAVRQSMFNKNAVSPENLQNWHMSNIYEIYPVWRYRYAPGVTKNTEHIFSLLVPREIPVVLAPREHVNYQWLPYREAADLCFSPSNAEAILQLPAYAKYI